VTTLRLSMLEAIEKVLRKAVYIVRPGYGPQQLSISLAGGARLQGGLALFAMTAS